MQQNGATPDRLRDQLSVEGPLSDEQRAQVFRWLAAMNDAVAPAAGSPAAAAAEPANVLSMMQPILQQLAQHKLPQTNQPSFNGQTHQCGQQTQQAPAWTPQRLGSRPEHQSEEQHSVLAAPAPFSGGGSSLSGALTGGLPGMLSPLTPAAGAQASLPPPLFLGSPAATPSGGGAAARLFGGDFGTFSGGFFGGTVPGLDGIDLGNAGFNGGLGSAALGSGGDLAGGVSGQHGLASQASLQQMPLWSAADVLPATLGAGGLLELPPGTVLLPPPPMPQPLGAGGDGPAAFRSRAPRRKRARIMRDGQLTMIVYGANEALLWTRRVAAFQHHMRGVLGDRRLTFNWGGSVLDSVVGVFLTQNVADHLSSRAYMELTSRFPARHRRELMQGGGLSTGDADGGADGASTGDGGWTSREDSVDWEAVRTASHADLSDAIKCRGMQFRLADQIIRFLNQIREHNLARIRKQRRAERKAERAAVQGLMGEMLDAVSASEAFAQAAGEDAAATAPDAADADALGCLSDAAGGGTGNRRRRGHISLEYEDDNNAAARSAGVASGAAGKSGPRPKLPAGSAREEEEEEVPAHELLSLEWLRDAPDGVARDYLMNIDGLGRKSVGCIMLLTLGKKEFPVDTNVGRICARLGWLPLETEQKVEDLDDYAPEPEVHAYLHSRLLGFDVETLYELHFQMITLGKVFCNKQQPNCSACPMNDACEYAQNNGPSLHGRKRVRQPDPVLGDGMAEPLLPEHDARRFGTAGGGGMRDFIVADDRRGRRRRRGSDDDDDCSSISGGSDSGASEEEELEGEEDTSSEEEEGGEGGPPPMTRRRAAEAEAAGPQPTLRQVFAAAMAEANAKGARVHWKTLERLTRMHQLELQAALQAQALDLDELLATVPRRTRTPGRRPTTRFARARKLKRSRELAQLLQGAEEDEREELLELGAKGRVGEWRSRGRGRAAIKAADAGTAAAPPSLPQQRRGLAGWGGAIERGIPAVEPVEPCQEEEEEEEEGVDSDSSDYEPSPSPEADRRCARGVAAAASTAEAGGDADATPAPRTRHQAAAGDAGPRAPRAGGDSRRAGEPDMAPPGPEEHVGAEPPGHPAVGAAAEGRPAGATLDRLAGGGTNLSELFAAAASEFITSRQKQPGTAPPPPPPWALPTPVPTASELPLVSAADPATAAAAQLANSSGGQFNNILTAAASAFIASHQKLRGGPLAPQAAQPPLPAAAAPDRELPAQAAPLAAEPTSKEGQESQRAWHTEPQPATPAVAAGPPLAPSGELASHQQDESDFPTATVAEASQGTDEEADAEPASQAAGDAVAEADGGAAAVAAAASALASEEGSDVCPAETAAPLAAAAAAPAAAVGVSALGDAAEECERLEGCGQRLAAAQRALLVAEGKGPGTDLSPFYCRLVEVSLEILGLEAALTADSALAVMSAAKRAYRQLSMRVHPDRCILPSAEGAFAAASQAVEILREQAEALPRAPPAPLSAPAADGDQQAAGEGGAAGVGAVEEADPGAVVRFVDAEELLQQAVWNQNRLAVPAMLVSPEELRGRGLLHPGYQQQFAEGSSLAAEPLVFLPVASIPTLRKRRRLLTAPPALRAAVSGGGGDVAPTLRAAQPPAVPETATSPVQASDCHGEATAGGLCAVERVPPEQHQTCEPQDALGEALQQAEPPVEQRCAAGEPHSPEPLASPLASGVSQPSELAASSSLLAGQPAAGGGPHDAQPRDGPGASRVPLPGGPPTLENGVDMDMDSDLVEGLLLVSARAALWGRFPLNGTYFQVNEVFADDATTQEPIQLPRALLDACRPCSVHFGHSIHFMCKGMSQAEVAHMFASGFVCFRSFRADTGAPVLLPEFLQPSIPTKSNTAWKNAEQRAAERAAKLAHISGLPPPSEPPPVRWVRVPAGPEEAAAAQAALPAVLTPEEQERGATGLELALPGLPDDPLLGLGSPAKRKWGATRKWGGPGGGTTGESDEDDDGGAPHALRQPYSQEARDAKSGKGRKRLFLHPIIRSRERCGTCPACRNRHWKKACMTRRAEQEAGGV